MKALVLAAFAMLAACNQLVGFDVGDLHEVDAAPADAAIDAPIPDASPDAFAAACDPINQLGCAAGQKCTWITIDPTADPSGEIGCVPDGTVAHGGACTRGPNGEETGYDNCVAGEMCIGGSTSGVCKEICGLEPDSCDTAMRCSHYAGLFVDSVGLCEFTCDPVTQARLLDGAPACGSPNPASPDRGCYKTDARPGICAPVVPAALDRTQDDVAYDWTQTNPSVYLNGCAPGFAPLIFSSWSAEGIPWCAAYCRPTPTSAASPGGEGGLPGSGYTCADRGAAGHECKYFYYLRESEMPNPSDNGVGICWTPANMLYDFDNNPSTPDTPHPACDTLAATDTDGDGVPQYKEYGCAPL